MELYKLAKQTARSPVAAWKHAKLIKKACTNKQGCLTSETVQPMPAQIGSGYNAVLMCMLHESLVCVECIKDEEAAWETCGYHSKEGYGVSLGRPLSTTKEAGYGVS